MLDLSRFIELPWYSISIDESNTIGSENATPEKKRLKVCVDDIVSYEEATLASSKIKNRKGVAILTKGGHNLVCAISFSEFENLLADFDEPVRLQSTQQALLRKVSE